MYDEVFGIHIIVLSFISNVEVDKDTLEAIIEAFSTNNKLKEFNYKQTLQLNDYILVYGLLCF